MSGAAIRQAPAGSAAGASRAGNGFLLLLAKDLRLACPVLIPAAVTVFLFAVIGVVVSYRAGDTPPPLPRLDWHFALRPLGAILAFALVLVPGWSAAAMVVGDASRRGATLLATLPVPGAVRWWSKAGIVLACMAGIAAAHVGIGLWTRGAGTIWDPGLDVQDGVVTPTRLLAVGALLGLSALFVAWNYAVTSIVRGLLASMVLSAAIPTGCIVLAIVAGGWTFDLWRSFAWSLTGFAPSLDGNGPAAPFWDLYRERALLVAFGLAFVVGMLVAWRGRGRVTRAAGPARQPGSVLGATAAMVVAAAALTGPIAAIVASWAPSWQERLAANQAVRAAVERACDLPTPDLLRELLAAMQTRPDSGAIAWKRLTQPPCAWEPGARAEAERGMGNFAVDGPALIAWAARMRERPDECRAAIAAATDRLDAMSATERIALASLVGPEAVGVQAMRALAAATDEGQRLQATYALGVQWLVAGEAMRGSRSTDCIASEPAQSYVALVRGGAVLMSRMLRPGMPRTWQQPVDGDPRLVAIDTATADAARRALEPPFPEVHARLVSGAQDATGWVAPVRRSMPNMDDLAKPASALFTVTGPDPWCAMPAAGEGARR